MKTFFTPTRRNSSLLLILFLIFNVTAFSQHWLRKGEYFGGNAPDDFFGGAVSLSADGNTIAISSDNKDYVRVFSWNGTAWTQKGNDITGEAAKDWFGFSVSLNSDGNTIAIGANYNDGNGLSAGHVRVFTWDGTNLTQRGTDIDGEAAGDKSGWSVSLSSDGNIVAIGATENTDVGPFSGHVRIYYWNNTEWTQKGADIDGESPGDQSGCAVSLSSDGNTVAIGAYRNDEIADFAGHVRIFTWADSVWKQKGADIDAKNGDQCGWSVDLSDDGNIVAIGSPRNRDNGIDAGHVRVFKWDNSTWTQVGGAIKGVGAGDFSGTSVGISSDGKTVVIGSPYNPSLYHRAGQVRVFKWDNTSWTQVGNDIFGEAIDDQFGGAVSINSDGSTIAAGAVGNDRVGLNAGFVRAYTYEPVSISESNLNSEMRIYPNPTNKEIQIALGKDYENVTLTIKDLAGKMVSEQHFTNISTISSQIEGAQGLYFIEIRTNEGGFGVAKVMKE